VTQGTVGIQSDPQGFRLDYGQSSGLGDIQLAQRSLLEVSGVPSGSVHLQAQNIRLTDGSSIFAQNQGATSGGILHLNAQDTIEILGFSTTTPTSSIIKAETVGLGQGNDVMVSARHLLLQAGGQITSSNYSSGSTGRMSIQATESIHVLGFADEDITQPSAFFSQNYGTGLLNSVTVSTQQLKILDGGVITSLVVFGAGEGGILKVSAQSIEVAGSNPLSGIPSLLTTSTFASGNGGDLRIDAATVLVRDGGVLTANTVASGNAGDLMINASESITVSGEGSQVGATALLVSPLFQFLLGLPERPSGDAGNVTLTTPQLLVSNQGVVGVRHEGSGNAGHLDLRANTIRLNNQGTLSAATNSGEGGNISIIADSIFMRSGSSITATAGGTGDGGNLVIQSPIILGLENSDIIANAVQGRGGNINITTQGIIGLEFRNTLTPRTDLTSDITASSQFSVNGTVQINNIGVDPNAGLVNLPVNLTDPTQQIAQGCAANQGSSFVVTGRGGMPLNPMEQVRSDRPWTDTRDLSVLRAGVPTVPAPAPTDLTAAPFVQATGWRRNPQTGNVELYADTSATPVSDQSTVTCAPALAQPF
jgi:large exoprotein involved in heme utilization and adhesion